MAHAVAGKPSGLTRAGQFFVYLVFRALEGLIGLCPITLVARVGHAAGTLAYYLMGSYRRLAIRNLGIAFGREQDEAWRRIMARRHFQSMGANFLCGLKLPLMREEEVVKRVVTEGLEHAQPIAAAGRPLIYAICHLSCWELLTQVPSLFSFGQKPASIYQPLGNPFLEAHVKRRREKLNYTLFDRSKGFAAPLKHLRENGGGIGVLVDQHAGDKGTWCPFFDRLASTSSLPALMALRCHAPLLPLAVYNDGLARWRMVCYPPIHSGEEKPTAEGLTAMLNIAVEIMIRRAPENWFWVHNRWKTPTPDFLLADSRRGITLPAGYDVRRLQPFRLLLRSPNWLGDACMALPAVRALKSGRPDLQVNVLCPVKLADLWRQVPEVEGLILKEGKESVGSVARKIRAVGGFDAAILFTNSARSTLEIWRAGVPRLVGYRGSWRARLLDQVVSEPKADQPPLHHAERYLRLVRACGAKTENALSMPQRPPLEDRALLRLGLCAGAEYGPAKRWPMENFLQVAKEVGAQFGDGAEWLLFGAPGEKAMGEAMSAQLNGTPHRNLIGKTTLAELIQHLRSCRLLLTNDTGTMHLAAALGVPTVSVFASTEPILTGPLGTGHRIVRHHVPCSPCFRRECPFGHYQCMTGVTPSRVIDELRVALASA